jgi:hypothetical protein
MLSSELRAIRSFRGARPLVELLVLGSTAHYGTREAWCAVLTFRG